MLKAADYEADTILGGIDGQPAKITDIRVNQISTGKGDFDVLVLYVDVFSKLNGTYVDDGVEPIESGQVEINLWAPKEDLDDEAKEKKLKQLNSTLGRLAGEVIDPTDEMAWMGALEGGPLHDAILEKANVYVKVNEWQEKKAWQFEFNCNKPPKKTHAQFLAEYVKKKAEKAAKASETVAF